MTTLDLKPKEVVLTFDDGPNPKNTPKILDALDAHCVKATFFQVGQWAAHYPELTQEVVRRGHTVGAHSWSHPPNLGRKSFAEGKKQIERGFLAIDEATEGQAAPFFRYPGLNDDTDLNAYLADRNTAILSCDIASDDWRNIGAAAILGRTLTRLERQGSGIILFQDTKAATARAIPVLLDELKARGYSVVHIVPKGQRAEARAQDSAAPSDDSALAASLP